MSEGDLDGDSEINLGEFIHPMGPLAAKALSRCWNSSSSIEDVLSSFKHIDPKGDGANCQQELSVELNSYGKKFTTEEINSMFAMADINADGEINYTFKHIDSNGDGAICQQEPWEILTKMEESASLS